MPLNPMYVTMGHASGATGHGKDKTGLAVSLTHLSLLTSVQRNLHLCGGFGICVICNAIYISGNFPFISNLAIIFNFENVLSRFKRFYFEKRFSFKQVFIE